MNEIKILHCADLHIGAELSALGAYAAGRRAEILNTLGKIVSLCRDRQIRLLMIAGDLFDSNAVPEETVRSVRSLLRSIPNTKVAIVPGNHDYLSADSPYREDWGENIHIFRKCENINVDGVTLHGIPFTGAFCDAVPLPSANGGTNILLMHADLDGGPYNPVTPSRLAATGMDYIALGHVHKATPIMKCDGACYAYSGCPEPLGFDECGPKGVYIGTVRKGGCELEFLPLSRREYRAVSLDLSICQDNAEALTLAKNLLKGQGEHLIKLQLCGECGFAPDTEYIKTGLENDLFYIKVADCTYPAADLEILKNEQSLKGFFVRNMLARAENDENQDKNVLREALRLGLSAFDGREVGISEN